MCGPGPHNPTRKEGSTLSRDKPTAADLHRLADRLRRLADEYVFHPDGLADYLSEIADEADELGNKLSDALESICE